MLTSPLIEMSMLEYRTFL